MGLGKMSNNSRNWLSIITTTATALLALTALITVYLTITAWKVEQESARPYFVLIESPKVNIGNELSLELKFNNVGVHPAVNLSSETIVFDELLRGKPILHDESAIVNEIPKDASSSLVMNIPNNEINPKQLYIQAHFVVVDLQYDDPIINKAYNQTIYLKWNGVQEGKVQPTEHVRVEEKKMILNYFHEQGIDPKQRSFANN